MFLLVGTVLHGTCVKNDERHISLFNCIAWLWQKCDTCVAFSSTTVTDICQYFGCGVCLDLFFLQRSKLSLERFSISELITILNYFHINQVNFRSSGVLKPCEMCLVLGCPNSGCSTFLKTIADQRDGYLNVSGEVLYAGINAKEMLEHYKGEVVYNQEGKWRS